MLVFLSHSTTTEYTRRLVRQRAQEWNVECHIYEGGLLNPDFLASLEKTKRERGNERKVTTTIDDDDVATTDNNRRHEDEKREEGSPPQRQRQQHQQQRRNGDDDDDDDDDYDDDHCKEFIKGVIYGCKRPLTKDIVDDTTDDDDEDDNDGATATAAQQRRLPPRSRRLRRQRPGALNKWTKYLRLADKGYMKHAGFIASDPDFVNDQEAGKKERSPPPGKSLLGGVSTRASTRRKREEEEEEKEAAIKKKKEKGEEDGKKKEEEGEEEENGKVEVEKGGQPVRGGEEREKGEEKEEEEEEEEEEANMRLEKKAERSQEEEEAVAPEEGEEGGVVDIKGRATSSEEEKKARQRPENNDDGVITVDDVAEQRINQSIKREKTKSNSVVFPAGAILLVDDFEVIDERDSLVTSMLIGRNRRRQRGVGGDGRDAGRERNGGDGTGGGEQNKFRQHTLQTYRILSQLFSSVSNHFHLHVIAIAHSQNLSGSASGQLSHLARLVKNSIGTYTVFLSLASREKKNLLLNHVSGADYAAIRRLMQVASREGNNDQADEQNVQQHPAITFEFNPRTMNFREENTGPTDRDNAVTVPFSFLDHAYLSAVRAGQNSHHPLFSQLERRENRI